jgi:hypothetical protein
MGERPVEEEVSRGDAEDAEKTSLVGQSRRAPTGFSLTVRSGLRVSA